MANPHLTAEFDITDADIDQMIAEAYPQVEEDGMEAVLQKQMGDFSPGNIVEGKIIRKDGDGWLIDMGLKSEGVLPKTEFDEPEAVEIGDRVEVLLENHETDQGIVKISKRKADRIRNWERIVNEKGEGDEVSGKVVRKIKGGLLVEIGVPVFLPASQVDIRRPPDIGDYIGQTIRAQILKIDENRRNIVISRRKLIEEERAEKRKKLLSTLSEGDLVTGQVKNIADFGAFVDLGGIDGLLHITDMSWGRISHPSEMVKIDQKIEVKVLNIDREKEKIALGLKQKEDSPWQEIEKKYPVNTRVTGVVTNIMSYGAFVKLEEGIEGLVHISEMSWTRRISNP
jgi:small subunit ribosomal protein S1